MRGRATRDALVMPLGRDASSRFGPWIVGAMVYIASIALAGAMVLSSTGQAWQSDLAGTITIQVMPQGAGTGEAVERIVALLRRTPGITEAEPLDEDAMRALLAPWLGKDANLAALPVPALIHARIAPYAQIETKALAARLAAEVPGTTVDDHGLWLEDIRLFAGALQAIGYAIVVLVGATAIVTVVFATRAGLAVHEDVIEILHLVGAQDGYIARQFQIHVRTLALAGGLIGFALSVATIIVLGRFAPVGEGAMLPQMTLAPLQWLAMASLPLIAVGIGMATARVTVMRALSRVI